MFIWDKIVRTILNPMPRQPSLQKATFAAGCFWHVEETFRHVKGVADVRSGYAGGTVENPSYEDVCTGTTGHAESVDVSFDPSIVSYEELLKAFWGLHDPTQVNRQGPDVGSQYRSVIFYRSPEQKAAAIASKEALEKSGTYRKPIATEIIPAGPFYEAEEYHQRYLEKHGVSACPGPQLAS